MVKIASTNNANFSLSAIIRPVTKARMMRDIMNVAEQICHAVYEHGDIALLEYTNKFDHMDARSVFDLKVTEKEIEKAYQDTSDNVIAALEKSAARIRSYHARQMPRDIDYVDEEGVRLGNIWKSIGSVGIYVPGGLASYPSSVLMNAIPAIVAGVKNIVMAVPAPRGKLNPSVLAAAKIAGITEIYKIGGAQAIAAMAVGTDTVPSVDKIVGPGNDYVAAAKRYLYGTVGIDMIAGPSEILVVADRNNNPDWIAADLLSQAEHDENAQSVLVTDDEEFAKQVVASVEKIMATLPRKEIARASWDNNGAVIIVSSWDEAVEIVDEIAPEHLELALDDELAEKMAHAVNNAGAIFLGRNTPEAIGDYTAGPSHVLPTAGTARFSSGLSVYDFMKRVSLIGCTRESFGRIAGETATLANQEGLGAHALSVTIRQ